MIFPTISGLISEPLGVFTHAEDDTFTSQQVVDAAYGGMVIGAVLKGLRDNSVIRSTLGDAAYQRVKADRKSVV